MLYWEAFQGKHRYRHISDEFLKMLENWQTAKDSCHAVLHDNGTNKKKELLMIVMYTVWAVWQTLQMCINDALFKNKKQKTVHVDQCKLNGGF